MLKAQGNQNITILGEETKFQGVLEFRDNLIITGFFEGTVKSNGSLEIAKTAVCNVDNITANIVFISGTVTGDIYAKESIEMCSGSKITGNITTEKLRISDNVDFQGQVTMLKSTNPVDIFSVSAGELKKQLVSNNENVQEE